MTNRGDDYCSHNCYEVFRTNTYYDPMGRLKITKAGLNKLK
jgi:hypothetical protein